jgi:hypothetical protein
MFIIHFHISYSLFPISYFFPDLVAMKHTIMICGIRDLTDARYYAAMGVDWLGVPMTADPKSFATWHALREWVEGPRFAVEFDAYDETVFAKAMIDLAPDGMIIDAQHQFPSYDGVQEFIHTIHLPSMDPGALHIPIVHLPAHEVEWMTRVSHVKHVLIETHWTPTMIKHVLEQGYAGGFCFNATAPDTIGLRDYAEMDAIIELIQS